MCVSLGDFPAGSTGLLLAGEEAGHSAELLWGGGCRLTARDVHTARITGIHRILEGSGGFANLSAGCCELFQ